MGNERRLNYEVAEQPILRAKPAPAAELKRRNDMFSNHHTQNRLSKGWTILALVIAASLLLSGCSSAAQPKTFTVGVVNLTPALDPAWEGFKVGMADLGYVEGKNVTYLYDGPTGTADKLDAAAQKLVDAKADLILSLSTPATQAAKRATTGTNTPVVFLPLTDPVAAGVVQSLRLPGGNITGVSAGGSEVKRLQWQLEMNPTVKKVYVPYNPDASSKASLATTEAAAKQLNVELLPQIATTPDEVTAAVAAMPQDVDAIFILADGFMESQADKWIAVAKERKLPLSSINLNLVDKGLLFAFGHRPYGVGQQAARLADQILRGTKPADLPVETADYFLAINLKAANDIGLNIPDTILRQADSVVR
jgi:putative tryptophan/tyrosine transport system substrate-binding protein